MRRVLPWLLLLGGWTAVVADPLPVLSPASRVRAERVQRWRSALDAAESARTADRPAEAKAIYRELLAEADADAPPPPAMLLARAVDGLADVERVAGSLAEAATLYERALPLWRRVLGPDQPRVATTLQNLAMVRLELGDTAQAAAALREALAIWDGWSDAPAAEVGAARALLDRIEARTVSE